ncbi:cytochrome P460 family protein [bacterium]|nr:cytochrome P460 family protein [bacterium]
MKAHRMHKAWVLFASIGLLMSASGCQQADGKPVAAKPYSSFVSENGNINFPVDFPNGYVFIGSWAVNGSVGVSEIHAVYTRPEDVSAFKEVGKFPDGAVLVKEVSATLGSAHTTGNASWAHESKTWFLMIKDSKQRFPTNPLWGDGWGWAQFDPATKKQISTNYKTDCIGCHVPVKNSDWVYTYAYPPLGPKGQATVPKDAVGGEHAQVKPESGGVVVAQSAGGEVAAGKLLFGVNCASCHSVAADKVGIGPSLAGVIGRKAGTARGFEYSAAMSKSEVIWTSENIDKHIENPRQLIPGNRMGNLFPGMQDAKQRGDIVAFLQTLR